MVKYLQTYVDGINASLTNAGSTGVVTPPWATGVSVNAQSGGGLGTAGTSGGSTQGTNSAGAAAGASSKGPVTITNINLGQVFGNAVP